MRFLFFSLATAAIGASLSSCHGSESQAPKQGVIGIAAKTLAKAAGGESVLRYAIGCALPVGANVPTGDGTSFAGSLGLAPLWTERALDPAEQRWISACLLARTNLFGVSVTISMRGSNPALPASMTDDEKNDYTFEEGAFYGNLWAQPPRAYVCVGNGETATKDRLMRVCTEESDVAGISRCGFQIAGKCDDVCDLHDNDGAKLRCRGGETTYEEVITTFLKSE